MNVFNRLYPTHPKKRGRGIVPDPTDYIENNTGTAFECVMETKDWLLTKVGPR
jgi:hypothetical protein